jgi:hypothetical protein
MPLDVDKHDDEGPCEAIIAAFVYGPQLCGILTKFTVPLPEDDFRVCTDHIATLLSSTED